MTESRKEEPKHRHTRENDAGKWASFRAKMKLEMALVEEEDAAGRKDKNVATHGYV